MRNSGFTLLDFIEVTPFVIIQKHLMMPASFGKRGENTEILKFAHYFIWLRKDNWMDDL